MEKEFKSGVMLSMWQEWSQLDIKKFNWSTFHLIHMSFEFDKLCGDLEFMIIILGLGLRVAFPYETPKSKETWKELNSSLARIKSSFHGYASKQDIELYKTKKRSSITITKLKGKDKNKQKLFIQ
jgi:hypothetical protein